MTVLGGVLSSKLEGFAGDWLGKSMKLGGALIGLIGLTVFAVVVVNNVHPPAVGHPAVVDPSTARVLQTQDELNSLLLPSSSDMADRATHDDFCIALDGIAAGRSGQAFAFQSYHADELALSQALVLAESVPGVAADWSVQFCSGLQEP